MRRLLVLASGVVLATVVGGCTGGSVRSGGPDAAAGASAGAPDRPSATGVVGTSRQQPPSQTMPSVAPTPDSNSPAHTVSATVATWRLPEPLAREVVVRTANGAVVAGGLVEGDASTSTVYRVDLRSGGRTHLPDLAVSVHDAAGADLGGHVLVVGGGNATEQSGVQRLEGRRWRVVTTMPRARSDLVAATVDGRLLVAGGYDGSGSPAGILVSSNSHSFRVVGRLDVPVRYPAVAVADGSVWLFGGELNGHMVDVVQRVDPRTGHSRVVGRLPHPLGHSVAVVAPGRILLAGGRTRPDSVTSGMWWFDPSTSTFRPAGHLPYPLADTGAVAAPGGATYLLGGETPALTARVTRIVVR